MAKILIVDDEKANLLLMETLLQVTGYIIIKAEDGEEALNLISKDIDVILLDINMPKLDGYQVLERIRKNPETENIPVVMITGLNEQEEKLKGIKLGADEFLTKPIDKNELLTRIDNLLKRKISFDEIKKTNSILHKDIGKKSKQLKETFDALKSANIEIISRLSRAADYRDDETGHHIKRISMYSEILAISFGFTEKEAEIIKYASAMHDIGKIGIPDNILMKKGKLTAEEFDLMKTHTIIGANILSGSNNQLIKMAEEIALTHHEKYDGSGYPKGIKADKIPLIGRIVAIADVFDALTTKRPYKSAYSVESAMNIILADSGKHFDPDITKYFLWRIDDILRVKDQYYSDNEWEKQRYKDVIINPI